MTRFTERDVLVSAIKLTIHPRFLTLLFIAWTLIWMIKVDPGLKIFAILRSMGESIDVRVITLGYVFCVTFTLQACYQRRETALEQLCGIYSSLTNINQIIVSNEIPKNRYLTQQLLVEWIETILFNIHEYLSDINSSHLPNRTYTKQQLLRCRTIYQRICEMYNKISSNEICSNISDPIKNGIYISLKEILNYFERLRTFKDYRTPFGIRCVCLITLYMFPFVLTPYFVYGCSKAHCHDSNLSNYFWSWLFFFSMTSLVNIQEKLDDPFDLDSFEDDIVICINDIIGNCIGSPIDIKKLEQEIKMSNVNNLQNNIDIIDNQNNDTTLADFRESDGVSSMLSGLQYRSSSARNPTTSNLRRQDIFNSSKNSIFRSNI